MKLLAAMAAALALFAAPAAAQPADPAIGAYVFRNGREAYVEHLPDIQGLAMVEFPSGRIRPLTRLEDGSFTFGPSIGAPAPIVAHLALENERLVWREQGREERGRPVRFRSEDVTFASGDVTLAGVLTLPRGRGPFPAVVLLHGGGAQTRDFFWIPHFFARRGLAVLAYDKRGVGASSGDWRTASVHDLADDALAAVAFLSRRNDIQAGRIGLYGASAGGWTAPAAAARAPQRIAFVIARSPSALPERRNVIYEVEGDLRGAGFGDDAVAAARRLHEADIAVIEADGEGWEDLRAQLQAAAGEAWFPLARLPADLIARTPENEGRIAAHIARQRRNEIDPPSLWREVNVPVLVQVGALDRYVPGPATAEALRTALTDNPAASVLLYPDGDHPMFESSSGHARDIPAVTRYAQGYLTDLDAFLRRLAR